MSRHARLLSSLLNCPQMIEPSAGAAVLAVLAPESRLSGYDGDANNDARPERQYQIVDGVALIPIVGETVHRGLSLRPVSGLCSYQAVADQLADAMESRAVVGVVFDMDTPGGMADGCLDLAERIRAYRGVKPMKAVVNVRATSAGYAVASATDEVVMTKGGFVGSIGVVAFHADVSGALEKDGVKVTYLFAGKRKIDGVPELPLTDDARTEFQARIDAQYDRFCSVVAANRGLTVEAVRATEAAIYMGDDAIKVGLADRISTIEETIMSVATTTAPDGARLSGPGQKADDPARPSSIPCADCGGEDECKATGGCAKAKGDSGAQAAAPVLVAKACNAAGFSALTAVFLERGASMAAVKQTLDSAKAIADACQRLAVPTMADSLVSAVANGMELQAARDIATNAAAARDAALVTDTTRTNDPSPPTARALDPGAYYKQFNASNSGI